MILLFSGVQYLFYAILYYKFLAINGSESSGHTTTASTTTAVTAIVTHTTTEVQALEEASTEMLDYLYDNPSVPSTLNFSHLLAAANDAIIVQGKIMRNLTAMIRAANTTDVEKKTEIAAIEEAIKSVENATNYIVGAYYTCKEQSALLKGAMIDTMHSDETAAKLNALLQAQINEVNSIKRKATNHSNLLTVAMNQSANTHGITADVFNRSLQTTASVVLTAFVINKLNEKLPNAHAQNHTITNSTVYFR